jgi:uncharacterized protein (TIGR00303 family)
VRAAILFATAIERGKAFAERWRGQPPLFVCALGHTDTCLIPGLSAAGVSEDLRPLTPAADAEVVLLGEPKCLPRLPSNPSGAPGPAGITRAALRVSGITAEFVGAGLRIWPETPCLRASETPGADIRTGCAVVDAEALLETGRGLGEAYAARNSRLVIGESVPGGTTTALSLLLALGYRAVGRVSGSVPGNAHALKEEVACAALNAAHMQAGDALGGVSAVGDPMQPLVAGMTLSAAANGCDVLLAGGSQMIAVAALLRELGGEAIFERVAIGTTRWVIDDPAADIAGLARDISGSLILMAANLDFGTSRHLGLREYERGLVKEGVGAGGVCIVALLSSGLSIDALECEIDLAYDDLVGRLQ